MKDDRSAGLKMVWRNWDVAAIVSGDVLLVLLRLSSIGGRMLSHTSSRSTKFSCVRSDPRSSMSLFVALKWASKFEKPPRQICNTYQNIGMCTKKVCLHRRASATVYLPASRRLSHSLQRTGALAPFSSLCLEISSI